ncbi:MAG: hypothetical protein EOO43_06575, partial [Flavobacterium sp.]
IKRIQYFKEFERTFHLSSTKYQYSNNESTIVLSEKGKNIGIALLNDSWRCSSELKPEQHFMGYNQLWNANNVFKQQNTIFNIAVFHHPLASFNDNEREEIETILSSQPYDVVFCGHSHKHEAKSLTSTSGSYYVINGRSAFNSANEQNSRFQPGYNILDINLETREYKIHARKFIKHTGYLFDKDTDSIKGGEENGVLPNTNLYTEFAKPEQSNNKDKNLPNSYSADVHKIVGLLIGKSLYPRPYMFVRELVQNSVDACKRVKERNNSIKPCIAIDVNTTENYLEVRDNGDGMTKSILKNHFSVIGKSISQEFSDSSGHFDLISRFGIGFMSTFIVADRVVINTHSETDGHISFVINDVFKGFNYIEPPTESILATTGTSIRIYMKSSYRPNEALNEAIEYLRHIDGLEIHHDKSKINPPNSWNIEGSHHNFELDSPTYVIKLGINHSPKPIIASNSGFLIGLDLPEIIPYKFPYIIGGEINFLPKGIDFDMSRTKIMPTKKSETFRKEVSVALKKLFRQALESGNPPLIQQVINYLQYYLQYYDNNNMQMELSYSDFYSKSELINLCCDNMVLQFQGRSAYLSDILSSMKFSGLKYIFYASGNRSDYNNIVYQFLDSQGYIVFENRGTNVSFRDAPQQITTQATMQQIANHYQMSVVDINQVPKQLLTEMKLDLAQFPERLAEVLSEISKEHGVKIEIGKFGNLPKASVRNNNEIFLNHDYATFQSLIKMTDQPKDQFKIYLLGILGLPLH